jgi:predicted RNA-binding protein with TRAM domain
MGPPREYGWRECNYCPQVGAEPEFPDKEEAFDFNTIIDSIDSTDSPIDSIDSGKMNNPTASGPGATLELTIEKLVPGGDGLARQEGKVYFVPFTAPGERVRVRIVEAKKDFARAIVVEIMEPSPDRAKPPCPVFGRCGGCDWQHITPEAQLRHKVALAEDALRRIGGISFPGLAIEGGKPWRYRNRGDSWRGPAMT